MTPTPSLQRALGLFDATCLVVGSMIGSGIFIVSAESARVLGSSAWLLGAWILAGTMTMLASVCCAELAAAMPKAGGQYVFFREAYGPAAGFMFGWTMLLVVQTGTIAAVAVAFAKFLGVLVPWVSMKTAVFPGVSSAQLVAVVTVLALTASNATGLKAGTITQNVLTALKLAALLALTVAGLVLGERAPVSGEAVGVGITALGVAMVGPLFSQSAWNNVTFAGEEVQRPGWTLPRALLIGCVIVTCAYVAANVSYLRVLSLDEVKAAPEDRVATAAASSLLGGGAASVMAAAIMVSTFGCLNGLVLSGARVSFAMARDGYFFRPLERLNRANVPALALWAQAAWAVLLVLSGSYSQLLKYVISVDLLFFVLLVAAVPVMRARAPALERPFRAPFAHGFALVYGALALTLIAVLLVKDPATSLPGYAFALLGLPVYFFWKRRAA